MMKLFASAAEAVDWIHGKRYAGEKKGLENTRALLKALDHPEQGLKVVHVAGTNGKGSTCAMIERALRMWGKTTGLYTSPYLVTYNERVRVNGMPIDDDSLIEITSIIREKTDALVQTGVFPTAFELGTAVALLYFKKMGVEYAVMEVGLGGRLDATNVLLPDVCAIAAIGLDHVKVLGDTVEQIAWEKAGILKKDVPAAVMPQAENITDVIKNVAEDVGAPVHIAPEGRITFQNAFESRFLADLPGWESREFTIHLPGEHQVKNACLALRVLNLLGMDAGTAAQGLQAARWPGRLEWIGGILLDGGHNPQGASSLADYLKAHFSGKDISLVTATMQDKDYIECAKILAPYVKRVFATTVHEVRSAAPEEIAQLYRSLGVEALAFEDTQDALRAACETGDTVVAAGSLYLVGSLRAQLLSDDGSI